jgi:hypothetical protein
LIPRAVLVDRRRTVSRKVVDELIKEEDREIEAEVGAEIEKKLAAEPAPAGQKTIPLPTEPFDRAGPSVEIHVPVKPAWDEQRDRLREASRTAETDPTRTIPDAPRRRSRAPLLMVVVLLALGAAAFVAWRYL